MKKMLRLLATLGLFLSLVSMLPGCGKDTDSQVTYPAEIIVTYKLVSATRGVTRATLNWDSKNADSVFLDGEYLPSLKGSKDVELVKESTIFTFSAKNKIGKTTTKVEVKKLTPPIVVLTATVTNLPKGGGKTKITLNATKTNEVSFNGSGYTTFPVSFETGWIGHDSTFTFIATGDGGETIATITITVVPPNEQELSLCSGTWIVTKLETTYFPLVGPWIPCDDYIGAKLTFYISFPYVYKVKSESVCGNDICVSWSNWSYDEISSTFHFGQKNVISIDENEMIVIYESSSTTGTPWYVRETYYKSSNPY